MTDAEAEVARPAGGAAPLTVSSAIATDVTPLPIYDGLRDGPRLAVPMTTLMWIRPVPGAVGVVTAGALIGALAQAHTMVAKTADAREANARMCTNLTVLSKKVPYVAADAVVESYRCTRVVCNE